MTYRIEIFPTAKKELASLPEAIQRRISKKIDSLKENPYPLGVEMLKGKSGDFYRLRMRDYRILYKIKSGVLLVLVIKIGHRREVYRNL